MELETMHLVKKHSNESSIQIAEDDNDKSDQGKASSKGTKIIETHINHIEMYMSIGSSSTLKCMWALAAHEQNINTCQLY